MLPRERFFRTIQNQKTDKIPNFNIIMGFSAAYSGRTYREYASDYKVLCECDLRCAEDFRLDILSAISDPMREAESFGAEVLLPEDGVPYSPVPLLTDLSQVKALHAAAPENSSRKKQPPDTLSGAGWKARLPNAAICGESICL